MLTAKEQRVLKQYDNGRIVEKKDRKTLSRLSSAGMIEWGYTLSENHAKATAKATPRGRKIAKTVQKATKEETNTSRLSKAISFIGDWGGV